VGARAALPRLLRRRLAVGARVLSAFDDARRRLTARFGRAEIDRWWAGLPERLQSLAAGWGLDLGEPADHGNTSLVLRCRRADGAAAILKLSPEPALADAEARALRAWGASGRVPAVWALDAGAGAILLEAVGDGVPISRREPPAGVAVDVVARLIGALHATGDPGGFPPLVERVEWVFAHCLARRMPFAEALERGGRAAIALAAEPAPAVLLHGDLHPGNVLDGGPARGLVAIDPRPCAGDPALDAVDWVFHRAAPDDWASRSRALATALGCDADRLWRWCAAFAPMLASARPDGEHVAALLSLTP
jgi:streptomycin 6-kinase